jgi:hypothetical protein
MNDTVPRPPDGLGRSGRRIWREIMRGFELEPHEVTLLREVAATADLIDGLAEVVDGEGLTSESPQGVRVHPCVTELRQQRVTLARLLAALSIPAGEVDETRDRPMPGRPRGVYAIQGGA